MLCTLSISVLLSRPSLAAKSPTFHLASTNDTHKQQLLTPNEIQPSALPVQTWVDVTNLGECQQITPMQLHCFWTEAVALGAEQLRVTDIDGRIQSFAPDNSSQAITIRTAEPQSIAFAQPLQTLSVTFTTTADFDLSAIPTPTIELRRETVSGFCDIRGAVHDGDMGLNLGNRDFEAELTQLSIPNFPRTELLPIRFGNLLLIDTLRELGVDWVRFPIIPMLIDGVVDWDKTVLAYEFQVMNLCDRGIAVLPVLAEGLVPEFPIDSTTNPDSESYANFKNAYLNRVTDLVAAIPHLVRWEIWNEPDVAANYFSSTNTKLQQFAELIRLTGQIIRQNTTYSRQIVSGGISSVWRGGGKDWIDTLHTTSPTVFNDVNYVGVHPYSFSTQQRTRSIDPRAYLTRSEETPDADSPLEDISNIVGNNKYLSVTEIGWETSRETPGYGINRCSYNNPVTGNPNRTGTIVSETDQSTFLEWSYQLLLSSRTTHFPGTQQGSVEGVFWYRYDDIQINMDKAQYDACNNTLYYGDPSLALVGSEIIGIGSVPVTGQHREVNNYVPINHWWGIVDLDLHHKDAYCHYMLASFYHDSLDALTTECGSIPSNIVLRKLSSDRESQLIPIIIGFWSILLGFAALHFYNTNRRDQ